MADQALEGFLSPFLRRQRVQAVKPFLLGRVLDVGCGSGALADEIECSNYHGVEIDDLSRGKAERLYPKHKFSRSINEVEDRFDTVVSLAVIEHVSDPESFLLNLRDRLTNSANAQIVITTPHPSMDWAHDIGSSIGFFSQHANDEHEELLDQRRLAEVGEACDCELATYRRFLLGANQLAIFKPR